MNLSKIKDTILNLLFPIECLGCGKDNSWLCDECLKYLQYNENYFMEKSAFSNLDGAFVVFEYNNKIIKKLIKNFKYHLIKDIGNILGSLAYSFLTKRQDKISLKNLLLIPVPLHKKRENWRGFNQAEVIASVISETINTKDMIKTKNTKPQVKLDKENRAVNIQGSFSWIGESLGGRNVLLVDDVLTTGSTLDECASMLKRAGAKRVYAIVIAHG